MKWNNILEKLTNGAMRNGKYYGSKPPEVADMKSVPESDNVRNALKDNE